MADEPQEKGNGLRSAISSLNNAVKDLTSLHVQTYTGTIKFKGDDDKPFDTLRDALANPAKRADISQDYAVTLQAETLIQFDGDSYNFIALAAPASITTVHFKAVEAGIKTRHALVEMFKDWLT